MFAKDKLCIKFAPPKLENIFCFGGRKLIFFELAHGVTGNTSVFGTEESRFEP